MDSASETQKNAQDPPDDSVGADTGTAGTGLETAPDHRLEPREEHRTPPRYSDWASI